MDMKFDIEKLVYNASSLDGTASTDNVDESLFLGGISWQIMAASADIAEVAYALRTVDKWAAGAATSEMVAVAVGRLKDLRSGLLIPGSPLASCLTGEAVRKNWARQMVVPSNSVADQWQFFETLYGAVLDEPVPVPGSSAIERLLALKDVAARDLGPATFT
jgi:hypothetical protein